MKTRNLLLTFFGLTGIMATLENVGPEKFACDTYQGHTNNYDFRTVFVFDSLPLYQRNRQPRYIEGNPELRNSLLNTDAIGKRFCFRYMDPISPLRDNVMREIFPDTSEIRTFIAEEENDSK